VGTPRVQIWGDGGVSLRQSSWGVQPNALLAGVKARWQATRSKATWRVKVTLTCSNIARDVRKA